MGVGFWQEFSLGIRKIKPRNLAQLEVLVNRGCSDSLVMCHIVLHQPIRWSLQISEKASV